MHDLLWDAVCTVVSSSITLFSLPLLARDRCGKLKGGCRLPRPPPPPPPSLSLPRARCERRREANNRSLLETSGRREREKEGEGEEEGIGGRARCARLPWRVTYAGSSEGGLFMLLAKLLRSQVCQVGYASDIFGYGWLYLGFVGYEICEKMQL